MKGRDYLWCLLQMLLDDEEALSRLCPACREMAQAERCPRCGSLSGQWQEEENASFDMARFQALKEGERP